ncbi:ChbG/HpnK family deacetylase [Rhizobium sp. ARZ01]|uniref:ChbG/HpnK family deacetylase n=1 Tax=Rhizobium sp. ARZ01 TaxID=2769313 RepID=UPI00178541CF|nr:ChbG/HpnK family deacetylase [Rhizobium sp. ARZ01]MBD9371905.1 ChbG/HpnK family deacetylase [Rhizobium sp. ARZ01]
MKHGVADIIADDYGLSPGVSGAILKLIDLGIITGAGCMTLFPEWKEAARSIRELSRHKQVSVGLHATLTDFTPLSGRSLLSGESQLPALKHLLIATYARQIDVVSLETELDAQLEAFFDEMGRPPDFIDGHQHVHFLPPVRNWLEKRRVRLESGGSLPWLRGSPSLRLSPNLRMKTKISFVRAISTGFDRRMKRTGFSVRGPLAGFYDWGKPDTFEKVIEQIRSRASQDTVFMCHPGWIDDVLLSRDSLVAARPLEFEALRKLETNSR